MSSNNEPLGKGKPCQTKIQLTFNGIDPTQEYTLNLGEYSKTKTPEEEEESLTFMVQFKGNKKVKAISKKPDKKPVEETETYCPQAGETLIGDLNGFPVSVTIQKSKGGKPTKVIYDLAGSTTV
jgi:hypothetical protein